MFQYSGTLYKTAIFSTIPTEDTPQLVSVGILGVLSEFEVCMFYCIYCIICTAFRENMMTSSNGNIFRVTGLCAGNSPVTGEFPAQRPSDAEPWCFLSETTAEQTMETPVVWDAIALIMTSFWWRRVNMGDSHAILKLLFAILFCSCFFCIFTSSYDNSRHWFR